MKIYFHLFLFLLLSIAFSCKQNEPILDVVGPEVNIISPEEQATFRSGEQMQIQVEIEENLGLHGYFIWLLNSDTGEPFLIDKSHIHTSYHVINHTYTVEDLVAADYEIVVEATDHESNRTVETVVIQIK